MDSLNARQRNILFGLVVLALVAAGAFCFVSWRAWVHESVRSSSVFQNTPLNSGASLQSPTTTPVSSAAVSTRATSVFHLTNRVVFAANFSAPSEPCHDHETSGCQLFSADLDATSGQVQNVVGLNGVSTDDIFPAFSFDGSFVTYTHTSGSEEDAMRYLFSSNASSVIAKNTNHPFADNTNANAYLSSTHGFVLETAPVAGGAPIAVGTIVSAHEPHVSALGYVSYYTTPGGESRGSGTAQAMVYFPALNRAVAVSGSDGSAHCYWSFDGATLYCNNKAQGGVIAYPVSADGTVGSSSVAMTFPTPAALGVVDPAFTRCTTTSLEYGSFCDATHVLLTAGCYVGSSSGLSQSFTHVVMEDLSTKVFTPVGANAASEFGSVSGTSWTATCGSGE